MLKLQKVDKLNLKLKRWNSLGSQNDFILRENYPQILKFLRKVCSKNSFSRIKGETFLALEVRASELKFYAETSKKVDKLSSWLSKWFHSSRELSTNFLRFLRKVCSKKSFSRIKGETFLALEVRASELWSLRWNFKKKWINCPLGSQNDFILRENYPQIFWVSKKSLL